MLLEGADVVEKQLYRALETLLPTCWSLRCVYPGELYTGDEKHCSVCVELVADKFPYAFTGHGGDAKIVKGVGPTLEEAFAKAVGQASAIQIRGMLNYDV
jgi:hypothetical protein